MQTHSCKGIRPRCESSSRQPLNRGIQIKQGLYVTLMFSSGATKKLNSFSGVSKKLWRSNTKSKLNLNVIVRFRLCTKIRIDLYMAQIIYCILRQSRKSIEKDFRFSLETLDLFFRNKYAML